MHSTLGVHFFIYTHFGFRNAYNALTQGRKSGSEFSLFSLYKYYIFI